MKKYLMMLLVIAMLVSAGCQTQMNDDSNMADSDDNMDDHTPDKTFVLTGENFKFVMDGEDNPELRVSEGDLIRIEFTSTGGFHDWVLDEFDASTEKVNEGESTFVEFVADQKGTFEYYCSVGQHRANGMFGTIIVE